MFVIHFEIILQIIELRLPSFFDSFDPRAAAANFPSSKFMLLCWL